MSDVIQSLAPLPMRRAEEQLRIAGANSCLVTINAGNRLVYVDGVGGKAVMEEVEWEKYRRLCEADEDPFVAAGEILNPPLATDDLLHIATGLRVNAQEVLQLINGAQTTLSVEDYGDALQGAAKRQNNICDCLRQLESRLALDVAQTQRGLTHLLMKHAPQPEPTPPTTGGDAA